jgi:hypothetical protein
VRMCACVCLCTHACMHHIRVCGRGRGGVCVCVCARYASYQGRCVCVRLGTHACKSAGTSINNIMNTDASIACWATRSFPASTCRRSSCRTLAQVASVSRVFDRGLLPTPCAHGASDPMLVRNITCFRCFRFTTQVHHLINNISIYIYM